MADTFPLNPRQRQAVEHGAGPLAVLAGAGTGKTRVLTNRLIRLIESGVPPWEILAVTFTNKAAAEMRDRLAAMAGDVTSTVWVGTFHSVCARLLRRYGMYVGLRPGFLIYDEADQAKIIERLVRDLRIENKVTARGIVAQISKAKDAGRDPAEPVGLPTDAVLSQVAPLYQEQLERENAVDFADLLLRMVDLTQVEPSASQITRKFRHVLVDEFQDTNAVQYDLVRRLSCLTSNLTVVGDDDQAIYGWRGAKPENLLYFEEDHPGARIVKLEQNYRSTRAVLEAANAVIGRNKARHDKTLWTDQAGGDEPVLHQADDDHEEAAFVAREVHRIIASGRFKARDIAVLYRTNQQSRLIEEHLRCTRIGARVVGGMSFYERKDVRDVLAYLRLVVNPRSDSSLERIVNVPARGIGDATVGKLRTLAKSNGRSMLEIAREAGQGSHSVALSASTRKRLGGFASLIDEARAFALGGMSVAQTVLFLISHSGLKSKMEETAEGKDRLNILADLVTSATDFDREGAAVRAATGKALRGKSADDIFEEGLLAESTESTDDSLALAIVDDPEIPTVEESGPPAEDTVLPAQDGVERISQFLERLALSQPDEESPDVDADAVQLLTIHVAKGLEWPVVFVTGLEDGLFPSLRERSDQSEEFALEEERRLMYVAVTRARQQLYLTHARTRRIWGEVRSCTPSRFLTEIYR